MATQSFVTLRQVAEQLGLDPAQPAQIARLRSAVNALDQVGAILVGRDPAQPAMLDLTTFSDPGDIERVRELYHLLDEIDTETAARVAALEPLYVDDIAG